MNLHEYGNSLQDCGYKVVFGANNTIWLSHERFSMLRQPTFVTHLPSADEISKVFRESHAAILSFVTSPTEETPANSSLYMCADSGYSIEKLARGARYDVQKGLNEFAIKFIDQSELLALGKQAYRDTLERTGLASDQREAFETAFRRPRPDRRYLAAMKGDRLAAFLMVTEVEDWVSIGGYSSNEFLQLRPNNGVIYWAVRHYLVEKKFRIVDYGLSSVQAVSGAEGLNSFKLKMGFQSVSVRREFVLNPLLNPFANRFSWRLVNRMLRFSPRNPLLKKAEGALRFAIESSKSRSS
jgi:hypothetical protein